jgi:hypothetical protein
VEETFTLNFRFLSNGPADNVLTHILLHVTVSPEGDVKTEILDVTEECRG